MQLTHAKLYSINISIENVANKIVSVTFISLSLAFQSQLK